MNKTEKCLNKKLVFSGRMISLSVDTVLLPNGKESTREMVIHPGACAILAESEGKVILVKQFRYPCKQELLEIPAGKLDVKGEAPELCAQRELAEETPYTARSLQLIYDFYTAPGFCDERMYLYYAKGVEKNSLLTADEDEFVETILLSKAEIIQALNQQQIRDAKTIIALQYWLMQQ